MRYQNQFTRETKTEPQILLSVNIKGQKMKVHESITLDRIIDACERRNTSLDNPGFCLACGADAEGCEPDARGYECEACGESAVYGAEELLIMVGV